MEACQDMRRPCDCQRWREEAGEPVVLPWSYGGSGGLARVVGSGHDFGSATTQRVQEAESACESGRSGSVVARMTRESGPGWSWVVLGGYWLTG